MNPLSILGQLPASNSPAWSFNQLDLKKIGREALVAIAPIIISALETTQNHRMVFNGTDYTLPIAAAVWFATQFLRRLAAGPKA